MILNPQSKLQKKKSFSCRDIRVPTEKGTFLHKKALSCRKTRFPAERRGFRIGVRNASDTFSF